jgi:hypothetical protein
MSLLRQSDFRPLQGKSSTTICNCASCELDPPITMEDYEPAACAGVCVSRPPELRKYDRSTGPKLVSAQLAETPILASRASLSPDPAEIPGSNGSDHSSCIVCFHATLSALTAYRGESASQLKVSHPYPQKNACDYFSPEHPSSYTALHTIPV